jgi:hypothetical protein
LTKKEKEINDEFGSVLIFGRSGTGKTICLSDRLRQDAERNSELRQLFVARSTSLCKLVYAYQQLSGNMSPGATYYTWNDFLKNIDQSITAAKGKSKLYFNQDRRVTFGMFRDDIWPQLMSKLNKRAADKMTLSPLVVWTQIRSFLKGSIEVIFGNQFSVLTEIALSDTLALPHMYEANATVTSTPNVVSQNSVASSAKLTRGYQKIREVYKEYKKKKAIELFFSIQASQDFCH